jgi:hypothetical protein
MPQTPTLLQRCALGLWFLGLGALGLLRWWMRYSRDAQAGSDPVMQVWLWGSVALVLLGATWAVRGIATRPRRRES